MTPHPASIIVDCKNQSHLEEIIAQNMKVVVLYYSYSMPWGKTAESKMHAVAREFEKGNIMDIPFVLVNYVDFYDESGEKVDVPPNQPIRYVGYVEGNESLSTNNSAELEGMVTSLL
ncbi:hypothetical protein B0O80DRAFT_483622 [Mortierella sp. GBAus27b]|nr:hypothetical protein BGX31_011644 [Mortierella sp. GBA43]KAI8361368.1 hypothetical protein B0O80DRAFT_483622 [Mortierella sp. GBAus27b]